MATKAKPVPSPIPSPGVDPTVDARIAKITKRLTGEKETKSSTLPFATGSQAAKINRANELRMSIARMEADLKQVKDDLMADIVADDLPGLRTDSACIIVNVRSRNSLNKELLLTKLTAQEVAECYVDGPEYYEARIQEVK